MVDIAKENSKKANENVGFQVKIGSALSKWAGSLLLKNPEYGALSITLPDGRYFVLGDENSKLHAYLKLNNFKLFSEIKRRGTVGFAKSFMRGDIDSNDLSTLFTFFLKNKTMFENAGKGWVKRAASDFAFHLSRANTRQKAKENIAEHYDLGNEFYSLWLDKTMTYSAAFFEDEKQNLEQAQIAKYHKIANAAEIKKGASIFEIGSGWGGFAQVAAQDYGADLYGISLSKEQLKYASARMKNLGLEKKAKFHFEDYRDSKGRFDHVISIEMIEAVGEENWTRYFKTIHDLLKPSGTAAIQAITIEEKHFKNYRNNPDFIQRYIFPGGMLLTKEAMNEQGEKIGLKFEGSEYFGNFYAKTLKIWRENFLDRWEEIKQLGFEETFKRKWLYYLSYCEAGFESGMIDVGIYKYSRSMKE